jgi:hypothetical protein
MSSTIACRRITLTSPDAGLILGKYDLSLGEGGHIFGSECVRAASLIEAGYRTATYDHRNDLPRFASDSPFYLEQYRVGYACFKREVARVLQPRVIVEIGIGVGIGAFAMMNGAPPGARYHGIDNNEAKFPTTPPVNPSVFVGAMMSQKGYPYDIRIANSLDLKSIPTADLVHVDGDHSREAARNDVALAWRSGAAWILCDDARDTSVVAGIFDALSLSLSRGSADWAYFPDTWTGSILIRTDHRGAE